MQVYLIFKNTLHHKTHFACSVSPLRAAYAAPSTAYPPTHKCVNSRPPSQAEAKIVVPVVRTVVVPFAYSAVVRVVVPTAAAFDAVRA